MNTARALTSYIIGFVSSIVLTLMAYFSVVDHLFSRDSLIAVIMLLAFVQFAVQLFFFLHISADSRPRWKLFSFLFMLALLLVIVLGSLWVMHSLNSRMLMTPQQMEKYMQSQSGL